ncbi:MAG: type IV pilus assembly protein PilM [Bacteriovoracales bacterium]|nr:type IV pilus assembly protein PilM [Bacteriovoracales bacterium]
MGALNLKRFLSQIGLAPQKVLGVDIGSSSVKICEFSASKQSYKLINFAIRPLPQGAFFEDEIQKYDEIVDILKDLIRESKIKSSYACVGFWGTDVISKLIKVPSGTKEEIKDEVLWESEQYIPFDIDDGTLSFDIVGEDKGGGVDVLFVVAKTESVEKFKTLVEDAGFIIKIIDLNQFALANLFSHVCRDQLVKSDKPLVLIDVGANSTNIIIQQGLKLVFNKEIPVGGQIITDEIQKVTDLEYEQAEDLKVNGDQNGNIPEEIVKIIDSSLDLLLSKIKKTLDFYMSSVGIDRFGACYLTGGSSSLPGLSERLRADLGVEILFFNPFDKIDVNEKVFDEDFLSLASSLGATAMGLAMRTLDEQ